MSSFASTPAAAPAAAACSVDWMPPRPPPSAAAGLPLVGFRFSCAAADDADAILIARTMRMARRLVRPPAPRDDAVRLPCARVRSGRVFVVSHCFCFLHIVQRWSDFSSESSKSWRPEIDGSQGVQSIQAQGTVTSIACTEPRHVHWQRGDRNIELNRSPPKSVGLLLGPRRRVVGPLASRVRYVVGCRLTPKDTITMYDHSTAPLRDRDLSWLN